MHHAHKYSCTCLCVCYSTREIVESLCVSVPLDPAEVLHYSLRCFGQTLGIHHHLVHTDTFIFILVTHSEFLMQSSPGGHETQYIL